MSRGLTMWCDVWDSRVCVCFTLLVGIARQGPDESKPVVVVLVSVCTCVYRRLGLRGATRPRRGVGTIG